jgi:hypothetical protein
MVVEMRAFDPSIFANERDDVYDANAVSETQGETHASRDTA